MTDAGDSMERERKSVAQTAATMTRTERTKRSGEKEGGAIGAYGQRGRVSDTINDIGD